MRRYAFLAILVSACAAEREAGISKEDAADLAGGADLGTDLCEDNAWYDDAECDAFCPRPDPDCGALRNLDGEGPTLCAGVRGNGPRMTAHWSSLARIIEHHGLIDGVAGGSSASITSFLLDSVQMNPHVVCEDCSAQEKAARAALLLKSLQGYVESLAVSEEALAFRALQEVRDRVRAGEIASLLESDPPAGVVALRTLLESQDLRAVINPEVLELLRNSAQPVFHAQATVAALQAALDFDATDAGIFVRTGVLSFEGLGGHIGRMASFYAAYEPVDPAGMEAFLAACATPSRGLTWAETAALEAGETTCGARFKALLRAYRVRLDGGNFPSRMDDRVGAGMHTLISTSVLEGDAVTAYQNARAQYLAAEPITWTSSFDDVAYGYWGATDDLARVAANPEGYTDLKTGKFTSLGSVTWRTALAYSPAEPGLSRALELPDGRISAGGWSDLAPSLVLRNLGCDQIIYVTRRGGSATFAAGIASLLGLTAEERPLLFDAGNPRSSFALSIAEPEGVWCTDWDTPPVQDLAAMEAVGYDAPFEFRDPSLGQAGYEHASADVGFVGCSIGLN